MDRKHCVSKLLLAFILILLASACVTVRRSELATRSYIPVNGTDTKVNRPPLNTETQVEVGQSMVSSYRRVVRPAIVLKDTIVHRGVNLGRAFTLTIPAGKLVARASDSGGTYYEAANLLTFEVGAGAISVSGGVFIPNNPGSPTEIYWLAPGSQVPLNDVHSGIRYESTTIEERGVSSFQRELIYTGVSQNTISLLYREFSDNTARPAFSQALQYDLTKGDTIGFGGARFQIITANNVSIKYKVLHYLE